MKNCRYTILGIIVALTTYIVLPMMGFDLVTILAKLEKWEVDELVLSLIIIIIGMYVDSLNENNHRSQQRVNEIYKSTMQGVSHIVNNLLNNMTLIEIEASENFKVSELTLKLLRESIDTAASTINELSDLDMIQSENINRIAFSNVMSQDVESPDCND